MQYFKYFLFFFCSFENHSCHILKKAKFNWIYWSLRSEKTSVFTESQRRRKLYSHSLIETVAKVSQQLAHVTGQSQLLHFENKVLRKIALLIFEEHVPERKIQNI